jgi:GGDEF domain-containing protein
MSGTASSIGDLEVRSRAVPPTPSVSRMMSAGPSAQLDQFKDAELLRQGKVNVIALDAVVARLGDRWEHRRAQVHDHVERTLQKHLGAQGYFLRVSDTDFLICQPELGRFSAQAACLRYLREILHHFMGDSAEADNCLHQVTKLDGAEMKAEKVDAGLVEREELVEQAEMASAAKAGADRAKTMDRWSPFVASDGRELRVSCTLEPVFELKNFGRIGFRMARRVLVVGTNEEVPAATVSNLSRSDILRIDLATIARGMDRLQSDNAEERHPSLIVPVSFINLSNQQSRAQIVSLLKEASALVKQGVICEVCDIEGVPQGAMLSAISLIRPFSLFVVGRLSATPPQSAVIAQLKGAGLQALSLECPRDLAEPEFMSWAKATIESAKRVCKSVLVYRTDSARGAGMAGLLGATHASVRN